jgi:hypothetical protein
VVLDMNRFRECPHLKSWRTTLPKRLATKAD